MRRTRDPAFSRYWCSAPPPPSSFVAGWAVVRTPRGSSTNHRTCQDTKNGNVDFQSSTQLQAFYSSQHLPRTRCHSTLARLDAPRGAHAHLPPDAHPGTHPERARGVRAACRRPAWPRICAAHHAPPRAQEALHLAERAAAHAATRARPHDGRPPRDARSASRPRAHAASAALPHTDAHLAMPRKRAARPAGWESAAVGAWVGAPALPPNTPHPPTRARTHPSPLGWHYTPLAQA